MCLALSFGEETADFKFVFQTLSDFGLKPKYLVSDDSSAIKNAAKSVWNDIKNIDCFFHVKKNYESKIRGLSSEVSDQIRYQMGVIQVCPNENVFKHLSAEFIKQHDERVGSIFTKYFEDTMNWYEGFAVTYPSTNNGLESTNAVIKNQFTWRNRLALNQFFSVVLKIVESWSSLTKPDNPNMVDWASVVDVPMNIWIEGYHLSKSPVSIISNVLILI